jgi:hypothetical protein
MTEKNRNEVSTPAYEYINNTSYRLLVGLVSPASAAPRGLQPLFIPSFLPCSPKAGRLSVAVSDCGHRKYLVEIEDEPRNGADDKHDDHVEKNKLFIRTLLIRDNWVNWELFDSASLYVYYSLRTIYVLQRIHRRCFCC